MTRQSQAADTDRPRVFRRWPLVVQCLLVSGLAAAGVLAPPAEGAMLLVPLAAGTSAGDLIDAASARGARLVGAGPVRSSIVVIADRASLWRAMLAHGTLVIAASPKLCGNPAEARA